MRLLGPAAECKNQCKCKLLKGDLFIFFLPSQCRNALPEGLKRQQVGGGDTRRGGGWRDGEEVNELFSKSRVRSREPPSGRGPD